MLRSARKHPSAAPTTVSIAPPIDASNERSERPPILELTPSSHNVRHELRTPVGLIQGFCEALLRPSGQNQPIPAPYRADVEAILRNAQQLDTIITRLFYDLANPPAAESTVPKSTSTKKTVILFDESGAISEMLNLYTSRLKIIRAESVEELGRLGPEVDPAVVILGGGDSSQIPLVAQLVGRQIPILTVSLTSASRQINYLSKPVQFDVLESALKAIPSPIREVLIVDDNRDSVNLLSRMILDLPQAPHLTKAYSGHDALAILKSQIPDVIFLDFVLPDIDGLVILDYLRAEARLSHVPIIVMSAHRPQPAMPVSRITTLTLFHLTGLSPVKLAYQIEQLLADVPTAF
jgi:CheY-like chemotaxis protein